MSIPSQNPSPGNEENCAIDANPARSVSAADADSERPLASASSLTSDTVLLSGKIGGPPENTAQLGTEAGNVPEQFGRYRIERELGRGGMGAVFLAHDGQLGRKVALKVPFFSDTDPGEAIERFHREARAMATVQHANLCPVYDVGQFERWHFLTMAFIDGQPLSEKLKKDGSIPVVQAVQLMITVALAVQRAHEFGIVHRDLKPANIMLTSRLEPIIMDFGLARRAQAGEVELTQSGAVMGSPAFMAPEQVEARHEEIGPATDVYAMGVVLYQMITGRRPFEGSVASIFGQIVSRQPAPPSAVCSDLPTAIDVICLKAMAKSPSQRYATAAELADELARFLDIPGDKLPDVRGRSIPDVTQDSASGVSGSRIHHEAELRQVTVAVFAYEPDDLQSADSSTSHSEQLHDQARLFATFVGTQVTHFGGVIVQSSGEEVIACFGFPQAFEDAPQRAVRAALQAMRDLAQENREWPGDTIATSAPPPASLPAVGQTWVTIHSGEAVAEMGGGPTGDEISLVGEVRNTVMRLKAVAQPGMIVISPATHQRVNLFFEYESLGVQRVRGMSQPIELFKVTKEAASRNRVELVDPGNLTPLIGRDTELTILKDRWEQALEELGQIVLLIGDAGLGKSRLIRELREHVISHDSENAAVIELRCSQYHLNTAFFPLVEYLSQLLRLEHHTPAERLECAIRYLAELKLDSADNVSLFCRMLGVPTDARYPALALSPQRIKELTEELLLNWLKQLVEISPLLFIVEDLHWIDPSTIALVERHVELFERGRTLTLLTFRPEFETPWKSKPHQTGIALNRLTKRQIGQMMLKRTKRSEIPEAILRQVIERTDGIPLFIEEFTSVIVESGILDRADAGDDASSLTNIIPATLHDLLLARLDRMGANREVIQLAATIGREFTFELLAAVGTLSEDKLRVELDKLVHAEILFQKGKGADASYIFKHALLQDAAYGAMLLKKRQACHQRIASVLETRFTDVATAQPALLAQHFTVAGLNDKAIEYWLKAGRNSKTASAVPEAIQQFSRGLEIVRSLPPSTHRDELELQYQMPLGGVLVQAKGYGASEPGVAFARAREICEQLGRKEELGVVLAGMWGWTLVRAEYPAALQLAQDQVRLGDELQDPGLQGEARWAMTCTLFYLGRYTEAAEQARQGIAIHDAHPDCWRPFAAVAGQSAAVCERAYLALSLFCLGDLAGALPHSRDAIDLARRTKDPFSLSMALYHGAWLRLWSGMAEELKALSEEGLALCRAMSFHFYAVTQEFNVAAVPLLSPDATQPQLEAFVTTLRAALKAHLAAGSGVFLSKMYLFAADALRRLGRLDDAQLELDKGFEHQTQSGERFCDADLHRLQAEVHFARGDRDAAERSLDTALQIATAQKAKTWIDRIAQTRARW